MRKNILSLSIAAMIGGLGLAGGASAAVVDAATGGFLGTTATTRGVTNATDLAVSGNGVGHILLVPYYSVQAGNTTMINLVNTDTINGKVVKVRFRGAANSDDVLDFQVFLSPGDVWAAMVAKNASGLATLTTPDNSCTAPVIPAGGVDFITTRVNPKSTDVNGETREGYIEILNMADIPPGGYDNSSLVASTSVDRGTARALSSGFSNTDLYTAIKHVGGVAPCRTTASGIAVFNALRTNEITHYGLIDGADDASAAAWHGLSNPTGGLFANWYMLNVGEATSWSGAATAVRAVAGGANARGNIVMYPQAEANAANGATESADPLFQLAPANGGIVIQQYDLPDLSTPYTVTPAGLTAGPATGAASVATSASTGANLAGGRIASDNTTAASPMLARSYAQAANLMATLARTSISNEFVNDDLIQADTDWVMSMPTRRYNVALSYPVVNRDITTTGLGDGRFFTPLHDVQTTTYATGLPNFFSTTNTVLRTISTGPQICVSGITPTSYDRSEQTAGVDEVFSPSQAGAIIFCGETSVWSFNAGNNTAPSALKASLTRSDYGNGYQNGWAIFSVNTGAGNPSGMGLPILGGAYMKFVNASPALGNGTSGNFGVLLPHRSN